MQNYIALYPNEHEDELNMDFLTSAFDKPLDYYVIACMKDLEVVNNIEILRYEIVEDQDEIDINNHMININYKKKDLDNIPVPKHSYMLNSRVHEINFTYRVKTNLNEKTFVKRILVPTEYDGMYLINGKKMKTIWQMVDASTYSRRGQITMKSRMPIMIYCNRHKITPDINGEEFVLPIYSYAQDSTRKKRPGVAGAKKKQIRFINPILIFMAKLGLKKTLKFWGMDGIVTIKSSYTKKDEKENYIFECNDVYILAKKEIFDAEELVQSFVGMCVHLQSRDFPVTKDCLEDREYWICRLGYLGSVKNKNLYSFIEKGRTSLHMIERLLDFFTIESLRLPDIYKSNVYYIFYWIHFSLVI